MSEQRDYSDRCSDPMCVCNKHGAPRLSLPTDSAARKNVPLVDGLDGYFPAALVGVAEHSFRSNAQHNPGQPMHWSINKSTDHANCIRRHLIDLCEFIAAYERDGTAEPSAILAEADALAWRALALSQKLRMRFAGAPLPFNAKE